MLIHDGPLGTFDRASSLGAAIVQRELRRGDEIGQLADALRVMVERLRAMIVQADRKSQEADAEAEKARQAARQAEEATRLADDVRSRAVRYGRRPEDIRFFPGITPIVGGTGEPRWFEPGQEVKLEITLGSGRKNVFIASK